MANKPTNPSLWSKAKSLARQKFDVYPSAYANGWAAKWYKGKGGGWRKAAYGGTQDTEIAYQYGGDPSIPNLNYSDMYFYATGGVPNNPGFNSLPEDVQMKIIANMKRFGGSSSMGYYQGDMGPSSVMDDYNMGDYDMGYYDQLPEMDPMLGQTYAYAKPPVYTAPMGYDQLGPLPAAAVQRYQAAIAAPKPVSYQGPSIVDLLNTQGLASDYKTRKQLAQVAGISNYRGTPTQNQQLISAIINNPNLLGTVASSPKKASKKTTTPMATMAMEEEVTIPDVQYTAEDYLNAQAAANPYIMAPAEDAQAVTPTVYSLNDALAGKALGAPQKEASAKKESKKEKVPFEMGPQEIAAVLGVGVGTTVYLMNKLGKGWVSNNAKYLNDLVRAGLSADDIIKAAKAGGRTEETVKLLRARGMSIPEALKAVKNIKFKPTGTVSPEVIKGGEEAVANIKRIVESGEKARKQAAVLVQLMKDRGVRDARSMAKLEQLIPNTVERMKMLKGIPMPKVGAMEAAANIGSKALRLLGRLPIKAFEQGGSYMPMYQGEQGGSEYEGDLEFDNGDKWYSERREIFSPLAELLDLSSVSSWDDAVRSWEDPSASWWDKTVETVGAIPGIGKIGKGAKMAKEAVAIGKGAKKVSTMGKIGKGAKTVLKGAGTGLDWISGVAPLRVALTRGARNPFAMYTRGVGKLLEGSPKVITLLNAMGSANRIAKSSNFWDTKFKDYNTAKEIIKQQPEEKVLLFTDDGEILEVGSHDPFFLEAVEKNAIDTTPQGMDSASNAVRLDTSKFLGPRDWKAVQKKFGTGRRVGSSYATGGDTYSAGMFYPDGGTFIPTYGDMAYGVLPQYEMGSYYEDGGMTGDDEMYVTPEQMEMLRQQGYDFDII